MRLFNLNSPMPTRTVTSTPGFAITTNPIVGSTKFASATSNKTLRTGADPMHKPKALRVKDFSFGYVA